MNKKLEEEAKISLKKLDELTEDILKNSTDGGDPNFRQIVFSGLTQTKNQILLDKMKETLFVEEEKDLKKTIILGIFIHKEIFEPVIEYGESVINMPYIDESYNEKESFLFVLDALLELAYKNKLNDFESATSLLMQLFKIACSEKSSSILADKLLQRFLNSRLGTIKDVQQELASVIQDDTSEVNEIVIAIDILGRGQYKDTLKLIEELAEKIVASNNNSSIILPLVDILTLALQYFQDKKYQSKIKKILNLVSKIELNNENEIAIRIKKRIKKLNDEINSKN